MLQQSEFTDKLSACFTENGIPEYTGISGQLYTLTKLLLEYNAHTNITAITDPDGIIARHYADSLAVCRHIPPMATLIDVGAGAGFPSLPIAIARPDVTITALDSTAKKLTFIDGAAAELSLTNLTTLNSRAECAAHEKLYRERFTVVTARAVAHLNILCELCLPFVKVGGKFIAMKGAAGESEFSEALGAIRVLGGAMTENISGILIAEGEIQKRYTLIIQKNKQSPINYPRNYSQINKKPL